MTCLSFRRLSLSINVPTSFLAVSNEAKNISTVTDQYAGEASNIKKDTSIGHLTASPSREISYTWGIEKLLVLFAKWPSACLAYRRSIPYAFQNFWSRRIK